jgi:DNA-binding response OmpR family regulator
MLERTTLQKVTLIVDLAPDLLTILGEAALQALEAGFKPEVVILDMKMPGLDGAQTLPGLRVRCPQMPILVANGRGDQAALDLVERFAGVNLLTKPFTMEELQDQIHAIPRGSAQGSPPVVNP